MKGEFKMNSISTEIELVGRNSSHAKRVAQRRLQVSQLLADRLTQDEIALHLGVSKATVCRDLKWLASEWKQKTLHNIEQIYSQEVISLNELERELVRRYQQDGNYHWLQIQLGVMQRRAALLGLDGLARIKDIDKQGQPVGSLAMFKEVRIHYPRDDRPFDEIVKDITEQRQREYESEFPESRDIE